MTGRAVAALAALAAGCARGEPAAEQRPPAAPPPGAPGPDGGAAVAPAPDGGATLAPLVFPLDLAGGRVRVVDLRVYPSIADYEPVLRRLFEAWAECADQAPPVCGYQVFHAETDRHDGHTRRGITADQLDGAIESCLAEATTRLTAAIGKRSPEWGYTVALAVAPSAGELDGCSTGATLGAAP